MRNVAMMLAIVGSLAGCGTSSEEVLTSTIPASLFGCWTIDDPDKDASIREVLTIEVRRMSVVASWMGGRQVPLTVERIESRSGNSFQGLVSFPENGGSSTYATEMGIGIRGAPADRLVVVEGDAGSRWFSRCGRSG